MNKLKNIAFLFCFFYSAFSFSQTQYEISYNLVCWNDGNDITTLKMRTYEVIPNVIQTEFRDIVTDAVVVPNVGIVGDCALIASSACSQVDTSIYRFNGTIPDNTDRHVFFNDNSRLDFVRPDGGRMLYLNQRDSQIIITTFNNRGTFRALEDQIEMNYLNTGIFYINDTVAMFYDARNFGFRYGIEYQNPAPADWRPNTLITKQFFEDNLPAPGIEAVNVAPISSKYGGLEQLSNDSLGFKPWAFLDDGQDAIDPRYSMFTWREYLDSIPKNISVGKLMGSEGALRAFNGTGGTADTFQLTELIGFVQCAGSSVNGRIVIDLDTLIMRPAGTVRTVYIADDFNESGATIEVRYKGVTLDEWTNEYYGILYYTDMDSDTWRPIYYYNPSGATGGGGIYDGSGDIAPNAKANVPTSTNFVIRYGNSSAATNKGIRIAGGFNNDLNIDGDIFMEDLTVTPLLNGTASVNFAASALPDVASPVKYLSYDPGTGIVGETPIPSTAGFVEKQPAGQATQQIEGGMKIGETATFTATGINLFRNGGNLQLTFNGTTTSSFEVGQTLTCDFTSSFADGDYVIATKVSATICTLAGTSGGFISSNQPAATASVGTDIPGDTEINGNGTVIDSLFNPGIPADASPTNIVTVDPVTGLYSSSTLAQAQAASVFGYASFLDSSVVVTTTGGGVFDWVTNADSTLWGNEISQGVTMQGDSAIILQNGFYEISYDFSYSGTTSDVYNTGILIDGTVASDGGQTNRSISNSDSENVKATLVKSLTTNQVIKIGIEEVTGVDPTFITGNWSIKKL